MKNISRIVVISLVILSFLVYFPHMSSAIGGTADISVNADIYPTVLEPGDAATLTVTIEETGDDDAVDVTVRPMVKDYSNIIISPQSASVSKIPEGSQKTFKFRVLVPNNAGSGIESIGIYVEYTDPGVWEDKRKSTTEYVSLTIRKPTTYSNYHASSNTSSSGTLFVIGIVILMVIVGAVLYSKRKKGKNSKDRPSTTEQKRAKKMVKEVKEHFPSELLKKYEPLEFIGEGGFAKVFKVKRKKDGKIVALKIPRIDEKTSKTFLREVGTWLHLDHPNIVKLYEADILPIPHLEMEYVEGANINGKTIRSLEEYPKPMNEELALRFVKGVSQAIKHAHSQNVLHRDIKPLNILLKHDFTPKLTDWGLSKIGVTTSSKTAIGYTPLYAAPEQLLPSQYGHTDHRTDLYQLGAVLYELLTGQPPYEGHSQAELIGKITDPNYLPEKPSEFNPELYIFDKFFEKALAKRKEDRFQSADELLQALENLERTIKKRKELKETVAELKKDLNKSQLELKKSKTSEEAKLKTLEILDLYQKLAVLYCELNSPMELLEILNGVKYYTKNEELKKDVEAAREYLNYYIEEHLPISEEFVQKLNALLSNIKREVKGGAL